MTDAELVCLAVAQVLLRYDGERHWLRAAPGRVGHLFPRLLAQSEYNARVKAAGPLLEAALRWLAACTPATAELVRLLDATPAPCGQSAVTARQPGKPKERCVSRLICVTLTETMHTYIHANICSITGSSMEVTDQQRRLLELCAIRVDGVSVDWSLIARQAQDPSGLDDLFNGVIIEKSAAATRSRPVLTAGLHRLPALAERVSAELEAASGAGARLVTVFDRDYPANLRLIPNLPPFLFYRGELSDEDVRSVAVVGTRQASEEGIRRAANMSRLLAGQGVTVVSGLAKGIDTAAHRAALDAGGRTIAVLGTGITKCYPGENRDLAEAITGSGVLVSQFWPTSPPSRFTFPRRNVVTSGISQGTIVIEATSTSGAKMQARLALDHGKKVFLIRSLVTSQPWARDYVGKRGAIEVGDVDEVSTQLAAPERVRQATEQQQQLTLSYL